jgi:hypothetical protein
VKGAAGENIKEGAAFWTEGKVNQNDGSGATTITERAEAKDEQETEADLKSDDEVIIEFRA